MENLFPRADEDIRIDGHNDTYPVHELRRARKVLMRAMSDTLKCQLKNLRRVWNHLDDGRHVENVWIPDLDSDSVTYWGAPVRLMTPAEIEGRGLRWRRSAERAPTLCEGSASTSTVTLSAESIPSTIATPLADSMSSCTVTLNAESIPCAIRNQCLISSPSFSLAPLKTILNDESSPCDTMAPKTHSTPCFTGAAATHVNGAHSAKDDSVMIISSDESDDERKDGSCSNFKNKSVSHVQVERNRDPLVCRQTASFSSPDSGFVGPNSSLEGTFSRGLDSFSISSALFLTPRQGENKVCPNESMTGEPALAASGETMSFDERLAEEHARYVRLEERGQIRNVESELVARLSMRERKILRAMGLVDRMPPVVAFDADDEGLDLDDSLEVKNGLAYIKLPFLRHRSLADIEKSVAACGGEGDKLKLSSVMGGCLGDVALRCDYCGMCTKRDLLPHLQKTQHPSGSMVLNYQEAHRKHKARCILIPDLIKTPAPFASLVPVCPVCRAVFDKIKECVVHTYSAHGGVTGVYQLKRVFKTKVFVVSDKNVCKVCDTSFPNVQQLLGHWSLTNHMKPGAGVEITEDIIRFFACQSSSECRFRCSDFEQMYCHVLEQHRNCTGTVDRAMKAVYLAGPAPVRHLMPFFPIDCVEADIVPAPAQAETAVSAPFSAAVSAPYSAAVSAPSAAFDKNTDSTTSSSSSSTRLMYVSGSKKVVLSALAKSYISATAGSTTVKKAAGSTTVKQAAGSTMVKQASGSTTVKQAAGSTTVTQTVSSTTMKVKQAASSATASTSAKQESSNSSDCIVLDNDQATPYRPSSTFSSSVKRESSSVVVVEQEDSSVIVVDRDNDAGHTREVEEEHEKIVSLEQTGQILNVEPDKVANLSVLERKTLRDMGLVDQIVPKVAQDTTGTTMFQNDDLEVIDGLAFYTGNAIRKQCRLDPSLLDYKALMSNTYGGVSYMCDYCFDPFSSEAKLRAHMKLAKIQHPSGSMVLKGLREDKKKVRCIIRCSVVTEDIAPHTRTLIPACPVCNAFFTNIKSCVGHTYTHHGGITGIYQLRPVRHTKLFDVNKNKPRCYVCKMMFDSIKSRLAHWKNTDHGKTLHKGGGGQLTAFFHCMSCDFGLDSLDRSFETVHQHVIDQHCDEVGLNTSCRVMGVYLADPAHFPIRQLLPFFPMYCLNFRSTPAIPSAKLWGKDPSSVPGPVSGSENALLFGKVPSSVPSPVSGSENSLPWGTGRSSVLGPVSGSDNAFSLPFSVSGPGSTASPSDFRFKFENEFPPLSRSASGSGNAAPGHTVPVSSSGSTETGMPSVRFDFDSTKNDWNKFRLASSGNSAMPLYESETRSSSPRSGPVWFRNATIGFENKFPLLGSASEGKGRKRQRSPSLESKDDKSARAVKIPRTIPTPLTANTVPAKRTPGLEQKLRCREKNAQKRKMRQARKVDASSEPQANGEEKSLSRRGRKRRAREANVSSKPAANVPVHAPKSESKSHLKKPKL